MCCTLSPKIHELKTVRPHWGCVSKGTKKVEIRVNDRDYKRGDILYLREYTPEETKFSKYTGKWLLCEVTHILHGGGEFGLEKGRCAMSINVIFNKFNFK